MVLVTVDFSFFLVLMIFFREFAHCQGSEKETNGEGSPLYYPIIGLLASEKSDRMKLSPHLV